MGKLRAREKLPDWRLTELLLPNLLSLPSCKIAQYTVERFLCTWVHLYDSYLGENDWKHLRLNALIQRESLLKAVSMPSLHTTRILKLWSVLTNKTSLRGACVVVLINWCSSLVVITGTLGNCLFIASITSRKAAIIVNQLLMIVWLRDEKALKQWFNILIGSGDFALAQHLSYMQTCMINKCNTFLKSFRRLLLAFTRRCDTVFIFIRTSNFGAEAELSYIFWRFKTENVLKMFLNLPREYRVNYLDNTS